MVKKVPVVRLQIVREKELEYCLCNLGSPEKAAHWMRGFLGEADREYMVVCCVDNRMKPTNVEVVGIGSSNSCICSLPELFKTAIISNAAGILLFHTHPSGETEPSREDIQCTGKVKKAGEFLGIELQDHIILGEDGKYFSFRESKYWEECGDGEARDNMYG